MDQMIRTDMIVNLDERDLNLIKQAIGGTGN